MGTKQWNTRIWKVPMGALVLTLGVVLVPGTQVEAQVAFAASTGASSTNTPGQPENVTFSGEVASIIFENCSSCHRAGGIAPMQFTTYDEVRPWAPVIADKVAARQMPPYAYDTDVGIQNLLEDWRLSQADINTIVAWVDQGAPLGDPTQVPNLVLPDLEAWTFEGEFGPPDLIIPSTPIDIPARGNDMWHRPYVPTGLTEDRCIRAVQVKPRGQEAFTTVHHANSNFEALQDDGSYETIARVTEYAMGKVGEIIPEGVCRIAPADSYVSWDIHLFPGGVGATAANAMIEDNVVEIGLWLHPPDYERTYTQDLALYNVNGGYPLVIPPHGTHMTQGMHSFDHPVRLDSFQPHGHMLLRYASLEIYYPDTGRTEVISMVSDWSAAWHHSHVYHPDEAPLLPAGAVLIVKQWYDNTAHNPNNPDPDQWGYAGSRTVDEMSHAWIALTHLDQEGYEALLEERARKDEERIAHAGN
jgi:hypothetical protein